MDHFYIIFILPFLSFFPLSCLPPSIISPPPYLNFTKLLAEQLLYNSAKVPLTVQPSVILLRMILFFLKTTIIMIILEVSGILLGDHLTTPPPPLFLLKI